MAKIKAPVEMWVGLLDLWTTTTVLEWTVVPGAPAAGTGVVEETVGVELGTVVAPVVEVELGAIVPGCAPLGAVVLVGAIAAGVVDVALDEDVAVVGVVVVDAVVVWTRAEAGIEIPRARSVVIVVLVAEAGAGASSRHRAMPKQRACARASSESRTRARGTPERTFISPMLTSNPKRDARPRRPSRHPPTRRRQC